MNQKDDRAPAPLLHLEQELGAQCAPYRGVELPAHYGDPNGESTALHRACGLFDRRGVDLYEMGDADRQRFLNAYVTCDVKELPPGAGAYGFVTSAKGRILADLTVLAQEERFLLELPPGQGEHIAEHLRKYIIVDRVTLERREDLLPLSLLGPTAPQVLKTLGADDTMDTHSHRQLQVAETEVLLVRGVDLLHPTWTFWVPTGTAAAVFRAVLEAGRGAGLVPVGHQAVEGLRVAAGRPLFGRDFGPEFFPKETGLEEEAVSFTKGCYLGQEVVARIHYRGGVKRHLRGLIFQGDGPSAEELAGRTVSVEGRDAGTVTSAAQSPQGTLGLGILHERAMPGMDVDVGVDVDEEGGAQAQVVELPFTTKD